MVFVLSELILGQNPVPSPAIIAGPEPKEPLRSLFAPAHHVREVVHDALHVALVHVGEETLVYPVIGCIFENRAGGPRERLDVAVPIKN